MEAEGLEPEALPVLQHTPQAGKVPLDAEIQPGREGSSHHKPDTVCGELWTVTHIVDVSLCCSNSGIFQN